MIVIARQDAAVRATTEGIASLRGADVGSVEEVLESEAAVMRPLFGVGEAWLRGETEALAAATGADVPDLAVYYRVDAPDERLDTLAERLRELEVVEAAYVKPPTEPAAFLQDDMAPAADAPPHHTPDFTVRQGYLEVAPGGIDARHAWTFAGGRGGGVRFIDVEGAWRFNHEDLRANSGGLVHGTQSADLRWRNHGTAVAGVVAGNRNTLGITGISPDVQWSGSSIFPSGTAAAIRAAADLLRPGDIILLEVHRAGPRFNFRDPPPTDTRAGPPGYIAIEWWPDDFDAIRYAVSRGVIVVEAAGNGWENLDDAIYNTRPSFFPASWTNPFNRANRDSGAIVVGAGVPPPGTHGRNNGPDRSRCDFSNWGSIVDAQGWGLEVTTTGYGGLQGGTDEDKWYTDTFNGTSSASPVVVGALACVQGVLRARNRIPLSPARARELLRATGSPQQDAPTRPRTQRIGNRPDLRQLLARAGETQSWTGVQFRGSVAAGQTRRWFTHSWPAHWHVIWTVVPTTPRSGAPQIRWKVQVERASDSHITYWISVTNLTTSPVDVEARFAVLGW